jgi:membrane protease YdiL (CAAX protease family)
MKWRGIFVGPRGLRAGWRFAVFASIGVPLMAGFPWIVDRFGYRPHQGFHPVDFLVSDGLGLVALLIAAAIMARIEKGSMARYGLPLRRAMTVRFAEGLIWGGATVGLVGAGMAALGGLSVSGLALRGSQLLGSALLWAAAMAVLGLFEEFLFRGYPQHALASGMGFWPAAFLLSLLFGAVHYTTKPHETLVDVASIVAIALFLCLTLRRTGEIWLAVGYHAAFDYVALVILSSPNTGMSRGERVAGHLLATSFHGPAWLTGGDCGMEASVLVFFVLGASFLLFSRLHPPRPEVR